MPKTKSPASPAPTKPIVPNNHFGVCRGGGGVPPPLGSGPGWEQPPCLHKGESVGNGTENLHCTTQRDTRRVLGPKTKAIAIVAKWDETGQPDHVRSSVIEQTTNKHFNLSFIIIKDKHPGTIVTMNTNCQLQV